MTPDHLARAVAADLTPDVQAAVEAPPVDDRTRAIGITEAMAVAGFIIQCAQVATQLWQAKQDRALLVAALANSEDLMRAYPRLDPEQRLSLTARILRKFLPEAFGNISPSSALAADSSEKQRWVAAYAEERRGADGVPSSDVRPRRFIGGSTILLPFADQDFWILYQPVGWVPDASDGAGVVRVDVPKGFVTDLASVPSYLWSVFNRIGRYGNAAIYHDWLYWQQTVTRDVADRVFDRAMNDMGVDAVNRNLIWAGVRVFGGSAWDVNQTARKNGERRVLNRFPDDPRITWNLWKSMPDVFA